MGTCLPYTGTSVWPMVIAAAVLVIVGLVLHQLTRRRIGASSSMVVIALVVLAAGSLALFATEHRADAASTGCNEVSATPTDVPSEETVQSLPRATTALLAQGRIAPGEAFAISQSGFQPFEFVQLLVASTPRVIGSGTADRDGIVTIEGRIPDDLEPGDHTLAVWSTTRFTGVAEPIVVEPPSATTTVVTIPGSGTSSTTTSIPSSTTTSTPSTSTTTSAPSSSTTTSSSTSTSTTVGSTTTTTTTVNQTPQTVTWITDTDFAVTDSPVTVPAAQSVEAWWMTPTYSVVSAGSTGCSMNSNTRELSFTSSGSCVVSATVDPTGSYGSGATTKTIVVSGIPACDNSLNYQVGDAGPGGGKIVYVAPSCQRWGRYLELAPPNWTGSSDGGSPRPLWCDGNITVDGAWSTGLGRGLANTFAIIRSCADAAANRAQAYRGGGKVDWYLASSGEWREVCKWAHVVPVANATCSGGSGNNDYGFTDHYWTSTATADNYPIENWLPGGEDFRTVGKDTGYVQMRPIRVFGLIPSVQASWLPAVTRSTSRTVDFTLDFSESVTGVATSDFTNSGTATGCAFTPGTSTGTSIAVQVICQSDGTVVPVLTAGSVNGASTTGPSIATPGPAVPIDSIPPTLTVVASTQTVVAGTGFAASQTERGSIYVVKDSVAINSVSDITNAADSLWNGVTESMVDTVVSVNTTGLSSGTYHFYGVDLAGNISAADAATITVRAAQACSSSCLIGDIGPGGGTVFYDAGSVQPWGRYLEFAASNWTGSWDGSRTPLWCDVMSDIAGANGSSIGTGYENTNAMLTGCTSGIAIDATSYRGGGFVDWFVPSENEQRALCRWVAGQGVNETGCRGGYYNNDSFTSHYWTSTQTGTTSAIETWMPGGNDYRNVGKDTNYVSLRPIRAFGGAASISAAITPDQPRSTSLTLGFTVDFSESISGLTAADFANGGTATGCGFTPASSSGTSIHVSVVCSGDGTVVVQLAAGSVNGTTVSGPRITTNSPMVPIDSQAPTLTVTSRPTTMVVGSGTEVEISERGTAYLVHDTVTVTNQASITTAADADWDSVYMSDAGTKYTLPSQGLSAGNYRIYAVDLAGNLSGPLGTTYTIRASQQCSVTCLVGDSGPGGGIVFYDAGSTQSWGRYLEVAPANWSGNPDGNATPTWCTNTSQLIAGADGTAIGTGATNTAAIVAACTSGAAVNAAAYRGAGLSDWFLPSIDEHRALCRWVKGLAPTTTECRGSSIWMDLGWTSHYWTSTQTSATSAWETWMPGWNDYRDVGKDTNYVSVRPIRAF